MQARLTTKPVDEVISAIQELDLESVKLRVMDAELGEGWTREYAESIEAAYKTYLSMVVKYQDQAEDIMLSKDVDEFWHTHILQTMKYADDCQKVFGTFLHHDPHIGERTEADLEKRAVMAEKTRQLYYQEFGNMDSADMAWAGTSYKTQGLAFSNAGAKANNAAFSNAAIRLESAAFSNVTIRGTKAAFSNAAISSQNAAFSNATIRSQHAAFSNVAIRSKNAAFSNATIKEESAAFSNAAINEESAAFSNAAIRSGDAVSAGFSQSTLA